MFVRIREHKQKFKEKEAFESCEVVVAKHKYKISNENIVFRGSLDEFKNWLEQFKIKQLSYEEESEYEKD